MIHAERLIEADGAAQHMAEFALPRHMVFGQPFQRPFPEPIEAAVADMHAMASPPRQDQRGEGRGHAEKFRVGAALRDDPVIDRVERTRRGLTNAERSRQAKKAVEKTAHRQFGRLATTPAAAHPVGQRGHCGAARVETRTAHARRGVILVVRPTAALGGEADLEAQVVVRAFEPGHLEFSAKLGACAVMTVP